MLVSSLPLSQSERHFIMQVVCEATQCNSVPVSWVVGRKWGTLTAMLSSVAMATV